LHFSSRHDLTYWLIGLGYETHHFISEVHFYGVGGLGFLGVLGGRAIGLELNRYGHPKNLLSGS
jgi:hypothetical protein